MKAAPDGHSRLAMNKMVRTLLRPVAHLVGVKTAELLKQFMQAHLHTPRVQNQLLARLIASHRNTDFGRDHGFDRINTYRQFADAVPINTYESLRPYMDKVLAGETTALLTPGHYVLMFSMTSGTTGKPKHIPVTRAFADNMKRGFALFGYKALLDHREAWLRPLLQISSPMRETLSPTGLPCGAISGLLAQDQLKIVRRMYVVPPAVSAITDPPCKYYTTLRCGIEKDVSFITTANPSSTIKLIEIGQQHTDQLIRDVADGALTPPGDLPAGAAEALTFRPNPILAKRLEQGVARDGLLLPKHFWNVAFLANWTGGTLKLYLRRLRELFGQVPIRDIGLVASEGRFSIPLSDDIAGGVAEITSSFLEFIPADRIVDDNPPTLLAEQLQIGQEYFLVVTNWAGLWRYNMDDRIRVVDRLGESPVFEFLSRGLHTANITGEKITEHQVVEAMRVAATGMSCRVDRFVVQGRFADMPHYQLRIEPPSGLDVNALAAAMDEALAKLNIEYASKRSTGRLGPIRAAPLPPGALEKMEIELITSRRGRSEQYKHRYLLTDVIDDTRPTA